jgi:hypothetical protein
MTSTENTANKNDVWEHFTKSTLDDILHGTCNICKKTFKCLYGSTSALRNHLKSAHASTHQKLVEKESAKKEVKQVGKW